MSSLIPDTNNGESSVGYNDKNDQVFTKKRRSFIPVESNLEQDVVSETKGNDTEEHSDPESEKNEQSGDVPSEASGDSIQINEKVSRNSEEPEESGESGNSCMLRILAG